MNPATIALIIGLVEELIKDSPAIYAELQTILSNPNPTPQDWLDLKSRVLSESFELLAPNAPVQ